MAKMNWPVRTIGEICIGIVRQDPVVSGKSDFTYIDLSAINQVTKLIDDVKILAVDEAPGRARQLVKEGDVLVSTVRPNLNAVSLVGPEFDGATASTGFCVLRPNRSLVDPGLLFAWVRNQIFIDELTSKARGASYPAVTDNIVKALEIPVPPMEEQKRIVELLDVATARVTELTACYEQARTHANDLFTSALRAALESNSDWPVKVLGEICEVFDDGDWIESKDQASSGVRLIQTGNVGDGEFKDRSEKARFISESTFSRLRCTEIFPGDLLVSRLPDPVGRACLIPDTGSKMITAVDCTIMRPRKDMMLPQFLVSSTQTSAYREQVRAKITGTTRDRISRSNLAAVKVSVPPLEEQKWIVARLDSLKAKTSEMVSAYDAKLTAAVNLRQSILEAAFAGDL